ncbi:adenylyltransferase/cytidyltransferase family protein [Flavobacteriaceae bacterium]|nr:adenylyltransferase/cytidyltransferase family protein [Flavobacteriaceae bacterium]MDC6473175.1 adenylyltransferase/cytidyltransferase family protein [Flavobacteriaceae bacterium]|tara:strand:+ start:24 stop:461 length:438 start_codon:yes stop_codon:yes gene_type:complete
MKNKAIIVSGYFNPLHKGHLEYFSMAKSHGAKLIVIVNNDYQRKLKGSNEFMLEDERLLIIQALNITDFVFLSIDKDRTVRKSLEEIYNRYSKSFELFFANGGDQDNKTIPEVDICKKLGIKLLDGLGSKIQSSSWLINSKDENK